MNIWREYPKHNDFGWAMKSAHYYITWSQLVQLSIFKARLQCLQQHKYCKELSLAGKDTNWSPVNAQLYSPSLNSCVCFFFHNFCRTHSIKLSCKWGFQYSCLSAFWNSVILPTTFQAIALYHTIYIIHHIAISVVAQSHAPSKHPHKSQGQNPNPQTDYSSQCFWPP